MASFDLSSIFAGVFGAAVTAFLGYFGIVRQARSDETALALEAWKSLLEPLQKELHAAREEIAALRKQIEEQEVVHKKEIAKLMQQIKKRNTEAR